MIWALSLLLGTETLEVTVNPIVVIPEEFCGCFMQLPVGFVALDDFGEGVYLEQRSGVVMLVQSIPNVETVAMTKTQFLRNLMAEVGSPSDIPVQFLDVAGREAAYVDALSKSEEGGLVLARSIAVRHADRLVHIIVSVPEALIPEIDQLVAKYLAVLMWRDLPAAPVGDVVRVTELEQPLLLHHQRPPDLGAMNHYQAKMDKPALFSGFELSSYTSDVGELSAYWTSVTDAAPGPAVLYVPGGFGGPGKTSTKRPKKDNDQSARVFADAGLVVMIPSFRGEAGNPGFVEFFYGETLDLVRAVEALAARPDVDPERIYLVGHSTGGTHVLNAAVAGAPVRAAFSLGGRADLVEVALDGGYGNEPFSLSDTTLSAMRSPNRWGGSLAVPTYYFEGEYEYFIDAVSMAYYAPKMEAYLVPDADHFSYLHAVKANIAEQILADEGPAPSFEFSERLLYQLTH